MFQLGLFPVSVFRPCTNLHCLVKVAPWLHMETVEYHTKFAVHETFGPLGSRRSLSAGGLVSTIQSTVAQPVRENRDRCVHGWRKAVSAFHIRLTAAWQDQAASATNGTTSSNYSLTVIDDVQIQLRTVAVKRSSVQHPLENHSKQHKTDLIWSGPCC